MKLCPESSPSFSLSRRIRQTPFERRVMEQAPKSMTAYNHAPLATSFRSVQEDYEHLCKYVQIWDVSCERQVEIVGKDALSLTELITPRDMSRCETGQCVYAPLVDEFGGIVNDPLILRLESDRFWLSIADSDVLLWVKGIAYGKGFEVDIFEPDVSPLAVQGPRADDLMADLLGKQIRAMPFFRFVRSELAGSSFFIARSGWSGQGGFEIYLEEFEKGLDLWDCIWDAGQKYNIRAGCPNLNDRVERGLLSYGNDMTLHDNPYECGLDRFFSETKPAECMSSAALAKIRKQGIQRKLVYLVIQGEPIAPPRDAWPVLDASERQCGILTSMAYSVRSGCNIALATVESGLSVPGQALMVNNGGPFSLQAIVKSYP